ncbi:hypothetical protein AX16_007317 [Volvariella volvacea WC 439]|nr:hypothetical protein AX16_007317 [Volvariella volvacea WC 439]
MSHPKLPKNCSSHLILVPVNLIFADPLLRRGWDYALKKQLWDTINRSTELRRVTWWNTVPMSTRWPQIQDLNVEFDDPYTLALYLSHFVNLTTLSVITHPDGKPPLPTGLLCTLPSLQVLSLVSYHGVNLMEYIAVPQLRELVIKPRCGWRRGLRSFPLILQLLERSQCFSLTDLDISDPVQRDQGILDFINQARDRLVSLQSIKLHCDYASDEIIRRLTIYEDGRSTFYFPSLQVLSWHTWHPRVAGILGQMIKSRFYYGSLQAAYIVIERIERAWDEDIAILESLESEGRRLQWCVEEDWYQW